MTITRPILLDADIRRSAGILSSLYQKFSDLANLAGIDTSSEQFISDCRLILSTIEPAVPVPLKRPKNVRRYFTRSVRRTRMQVENCIGRSDGQLGKGRMAYVTDASHNAHLMWRKRLEERFPNRSRITGRSVHYQRRAAAIARWCDKQGLVSFFLTITTPADYHDGFRYTPADAQNWLQERCRSLQKRFKGLRGFWVDEPNQDGCCHRHMVIWIDSHRIELFLTLVQRYFGDEPACKVIRVGGSSAGVTAYTFKLFEKWWYDDEKLEKAERAHTFRSTWLSRATQVLGFPGWESAWSRVRRIDKKSRDYALLPEREKRQVEAAASWDYDSFTELFCKNWEESEVNCEASVKRRKQALRTEFSHDSPIGSDARKQDDRGNLRTLTDNKPSSNNSRSLLYCIFVAVIVLLAFCILLVDFRSDIKFGIDCEPPSQPIFSQVAPNLRGVRHVLGEGAENAQGPCSFVHKRA